MARGRAKKARTLEKGSQRNPSAYTKYMSRASASPTERPTARAPQPLEPPAGAELPGHRVRLAQLPGARRTQPHAAERRSDGCDAGGNACRPAAEREPVDASRRGHVPRAVRRQRVHHEPVRRCTNPSRIISPRPRPRPTAIRSPSRVPSRSTGLSLRLCRRRYLATVKELWFPARGDANLLMQQLVYASNLGCWLPLAGIFYDSRHGGPRNTVYVG